MGAPNDQFWFRFWGVRGSIATPGQETVRYGGNTSCIELWCNDRLFIIDCGTGLRKLGRKLLSHGDIDADILLSHTHLDHIVGFPFFIPFFNPKNDFRLWAGHLLPEYNLRDVLSMMLTEPLFPVPIDIIQANLTFLDFGAGETLSPGDGIIIQTIPLNHPNNATAYRIDYKGKSVCYVTDTEHVIGKPDQRILKLIAGSDYVIYDATFTDTTFPNFVGWGHSTWQEGVRLCEEANAGTLIAFHHDPLNNDEFLDAVSEEAQARRPGTLVAREEMIVDLLPSPIATKNRGLKAGKTTKHILHGATASFDHS